MPDTLLPFGPFHIVLLHLPIGALLAIVFAECMPCGKPEHKRPVIGSLHWFLLGSTALTIVLGMAYEDFGGYGDEIENHELWGFIFGGCVLASFLLHAICRWKNAIACRVVYHLALLAAVISMVITGHQGGELVHGRGFLTKPFKAQTRPAPEANPAPAPTLEAPTALPTPAPAPEVEANDAPIMSDDAEMMDDEMEMMEATPMMEVSAPSAQPAAASPESLQQFNAAHTVFKNHCFSCHGATKQKGRYRLDNKVAITTAGKSGYTPIVAEQPSESELFIRMSHADNHDDVMPPEEKSRLEPEEIAAVRAWIASGANWPDNMSRKRVPGTYVAIGNEATNKLIEQINQTGAKAEYNVWGDNSVRVDLAVVDADKINDAIETLQKLGPALAWIDCSKLELPDNFTEQLQQFPNLKRLHLDSSNISDADLQNISQLKNLSYLNLYNTGITDTGLAALEQAPGLEKLYLTDSKVSPQGIQALQQAKPDLTIIHQ